MSRWVCALDGSARSAVRYGPSMSRAGSLTSSCHDSMHLSASPCLFLRAFGDRWSPARSASDRACPNHSTASACAPVFWRALACCPHASAQTIHRPFIEAAFSRQPSAAARPAAPPAPPSAVPCSALLPHDRYASAHSLRVLAASSPSAACASCPSSCSARRSASPAGVPPAPPRAMRRVGARLLIGLDRGRPGGGVAAEDILGPRRGPSP